MIYYIEKCLKNAWDRYNDRNDALQRFTIFQVYSTQFLCGEWGGSVNDRALFDRVLDRLFYAALNNTEDIEAG